MIEKFRSTLYGFIIGDILGLPVEAKKKEYLKEHPITDMIENKIRKTTIGYWSDDTSMTLCEMESMIECNKIDYKNMMDKFVLWASRGYMTVANRKFFGVGERTLKALDFYYNENHNPNFSKDYNDDSWILKVGEMSTPKDKEKFSGNGSLMRSIPFIFYLYNKKMSMKEKVEIMCESSIITHYSDDCKASCVFYMFLIFNLLNGHDKKTSIDYSIELVKEYYNCSNCDGFDRILNKEFETKTIDDLVTNGYVINTLESVIYFFLNTDEYKTSVLLPVNQGGDTDTIAALTGALTGLYYGLDNIPEQWINNILKKDMIDELIEKFSKLI
jgi:ADP-ribosylglycohydrolase